MVLRVVTPGPPTPATHRRAPCTSYTCEHADCHKPTQPRVCQCDKPHVYRDDETGDMRCTCGRAARTDFRAAA